VVTYADEPEITWGTRGVSAPQSPSSSEIGALYSLAKWNSTDVNGTGDYKHIGYGPHGKISLTVQAMCHDPQYKQKVKKFFYRIFIIL